MQQNIDLKPYNSLSISANSRYLVAVESIDALKQALQTARHRKLPVLLLGGGSNLVLTEDFPGISILIALKGIQWRSVDDDWVEVTAQAGENWHQFVDHCVAGGGFGLENLALIPGTVGAAPIQNIGAYGVDINDYMSNLLALDRETNQIRSFSSEDCAFGYRDSIFKSADRDRFIILEVRFKLRRNPQLQLSYGALEAELTQLSEPSPRDLFNAVVKTRSLKLPDPQKLANAGSFFKNPVVSIHKYQELLLQHSDIVAYEDVNGMKLAAGWLIDRCGWKGYRKGDAGVHQKQALVLVNHGQASGADIIDLARNIQIDIRNQFGVELEIEPRIY